MKFNFDKFVRASKNKEDKSAASPEKDKKRTAQKEADERRRRWLLQFREKWQNRIIYPGGRNEKR